MNPRCALALAVFASIAPHVRAQGASWTFATGTQDWVIHDCNCGTNFAPVLATLPLTWVANAGDPGGHVFRFDDTSNCVYFAAPPAMLGNLTPLIRGELRFSLQCSIANYSMANQVILIGANGTLLLSAIPMLPSTNQWTRYTLALEPDTFRMGTPSGPHPTPAVFAAVMANVATLRIPGEFGAAVGETTRLDTVSLVAPCAGDTNGDGVINFADLNAVLSAFGQTGAPGFSGADQNNDGAVNFSDLNTVLSAFGQSCAG